MYPPSPSHLEALEDAAPGARFLWARDEPSAQRLIRNAEVVLGNRYFLQALPFARQLRWMQSNSMGVDRILTGAGSELRQITLTCARGLYDDEMADHALALLLGTARNLHLARDAQQGGRWPRWSLPTLAGRQAMILGWGGIGRAIARRLAAFQVRMHAARRSHQGPPAPNENGYVIHGPGTWREVLPATDLLIMALPLTPETRHLVGQEELAALPPDAIVVNIGRGATLDERALFQTLAQGRLWGAGLDVLETEPPPADHRIWRERRILLTPHVGRSLEEPPYRWEPLFVENLRRYVNKEPLLNVVDQEVGY
jgi:phosphoglycerate dehydrogenase-like enzyme